ncbi:hypothetical protein [Mesorhizobium sp. 2RAF21]|uniref:hypothetical protein n=1 Tax=Mesorhizobium sp. 2RAF21 TaxID=3232995 RepID=UPI003F9865B0
MSDENFDYVRRRLGYDPDLPEGVEFEVLAYAPILWSGWEGDSAAVLFRILPDGKPQLHVLDGVDIAPETLLQALEDRIAIYERTAVKTKAFLAKARGLPTPREWRWCCTACKSEGRGDEPAVCPTCGSDDAWYNYKTTVDDRQPAVERLRGLLAPREPKDG